MFFGALRKGLAAAMGVHSGCRPILHLSAHGSRDGIELSTGHSIRWDDLRKLLIPINRSLGGALLLSMSSCHGFAACQMAMRMNDAPEHPFFGIVGSSGTPTWSDTTVAFLAFYHLVIARHRNPVDAVPAMRAASGHDQWSIETAKTIHSDFLSFAEGSMSLADAQRSLDESEGDVPK